MCGYVRSTEKQALKRGLLHLRTGSPELAWPLCSAARGRKGLSPIRVSGVAALGSLHCRSNAGSCIMGFSGALHPDGSWVVLMS